MKFKTLMVMVIFIISICFQSCMFNDETLLNEKDLTIKTTVEPVLSANWINLQSLQNTRQLGGYPIKNNSIVKQNVILRTGELALLTDGDAELLVNEYDLAYIIDLRDEIEVQDNPDPLIEGVQYRHLIVWPREVRLRIIQESTTILGFDNDLYIKNYYTAFALEPAAIKAYKEMFEVLLENGDGSVLIHCVHGKDRTGIAIALILSALDVEWDIIEQDYLLSNDVYAGAVDISSLRYYKNVIEMNYGSIEKYLEIEMILDENDLVILKEKYSVPVVSG